MDELNTDQIIAFIKEQLKKSIDESNRQRELLKSDIEKYQKQLEGLQESLKEEQDILSISLALKKNLDRPNLKLVSSEE